MNKKTKIIVINAFKSGIITKVEAKSLMKEGITSVIIQDGKQKTKVYLEALKKVSTILFVLPPNNR